MNEIRVSFAATLGQRAHDGEIEPILLQRRDQMACQCGIAWVVGLRRSPSGTAAVRGSSRHSRCRSPACCRAGTAPPDRRRRRSACPVARPQHRRAAAPSPPSPRHAAASVAQARSAPAHPPAHALIASRSRRRCRRNRRTAAPCRGRGSRSASPRSARRASGCVTNRTQRPVGPWHVPFQTIRRG